MRHALAAGDAAWAARLVEWHIGATLAWGEGATAARWLAGLPAEQVRGWPQLCALRAIQAVMAGQAGELERWLDAAEAALASKPAEGTAGEQAVGSEAGWLREDVPRTLLALRADLARLRGDAEGTIQFARQVLARLPAGEGGLRFIAEWNLARASWLNGELGAAEPALAELAAAHPAEEAIALAARWEHGLVLRAQGRLGAGQLPAGAGRRHPDRGSRSPDAGHDARGCGRGAVRAGRAGQGAGARDRRRGGLPPAR